MKRLFLFAAFDPQSVVGESLLLMLRSLSECGDVVFVADSPLPDAELAKVAPFVLHAASEHHAEYDFGSYKRGFAWACANLDMSAYDVLYMVNDSVFGPLAPLGGLLEKMESLGRDAFALVLNPSRRHPHLQSWFIGLRPAVFNAPWYASFLGGVRTLESKEAVCVEYEIGFTSLLAAQGVEYDALFTVSGRGIYNSVLKLSRRGLPFIKKASFVRHCGCLGRQIRIVLDSCSAPCREAVLSDAGRLWGRSFVADLLHGGPLAMAGRYLRYLKTKSTKQ